MLELLRYLAASKRPAAPHMVMGHAGAVGGVLRSKAYILGAALEASAAEVDESTIAADVPTRRNRECAGAKSETTRKNAQSCRPIGATPTHEASS
jgi:hypothetical protein